MQPVPHYVRLIKPRTDTPVRVQSDRKLRAEAREEAACGITFSLDEGQAKDCMGTGWVCTLMWQDRVQYVNGKKQSKLRFNMAPFATIVVL